MTSVAVTLRTLAPVPVPVPPPARPVGPVRWRVLGHADHPLARHLRDAPPGRRRATAVVLGDRWGSGDTEAVLTAVATAPPGQPLALLHTGAGGGSLLRALAAERPGRPVAVVEVDLPARPYTDGALTLHRAAAFAATEPLAAEVRLDRNGRASRLTWRPATLPGTRPATLPGTRPATLPGTRPATLPGTRPAAGPRIAALDGRTVVVTGGLGGLGLRVAAGLAVGGARPVLLDVRDPASLDPRDARILARLRDHVPGLAVSTVDLTDPAATARALAGVTPHALVHCAGRISGGSGRRVTPARIAALVAAKVTTLRTTVAALDPAVLAGVVTFGSVTARAPHPGLGGYAHANELLRREARRLAADRPDTRWLTVEWSLWSGAGMARDVARSAAPQLGMVPVPLAAGVAATCRAVAGLLTSGAVQGHHALVVAGDRASDRPVALPGLDAALTVPADHDVDRAVGAVAAAVLPYHDGLTPVDRWSGPASPAGDLLVRATLQGSVVDCVVTPADAPTAAALSRYRFALRSHPCEEPVE